MYLVMWTHVRDYDDWKAVFDSGEPVRASYECIGHEIFRDVDDSNQLTVFLEFPSKEQARRSSTSRGSAEGGGVRRGLRAADDVRHADAGGRLPPAPGRLTARRQWGAVPRSPRRTAYRACSCSRREEAG